MPPPARNRGAVVAADPHASAAGAAVLAGGGNATDAAIAMAGVLAVTRPHMCGLGGDAFALFLDAETGTVHALNGSGRAGSSATPERFGRAVQDSAGSRHGAFVTVPGAAAAILDAHERFGSLPLVELLSPAIELARNGFPVSPVLAREFGQAGRPFSEDSPAPFLPGGGLPPVGSPIRNPALAQTLEGLGSQGRAGFYDGRPGEIMASFLQAHGGFIHPEDFAGHESTWMKPVSANHLAMEFFAFPPNTQGLAFLQQLGMAGPAGVFDLQHGSAEYLHALIEIKKLAFADRDRWIGDPDFGEIPIRRLLDPSYLAERAALVRPDRAMESVEPGFGKDVTPPGPPPPASGDTVFLTAVDSRGNAISWIQSIFFAFGSGLFEPETGVLFHNRGMGFSLRPGHPNQVGPGKRPFHTLSPAMALVDGRLGFTVGTPGADGQTQILVQVVLNHRVFGMNPQEAIDAPRFRSFRGLDVGVENRFRKEAMAGLATRGHLVESMGAWHNEMGGAQMIVRNPSDGSLIAAADPRREARAKVL